MTLFRILSGVLAASMLAGCSSTSVTSVETIRGDQIGTEAGDPEMVRERLELDLGYDSVRLVSNQYFREETTEIYQKVRRENIKRTTTSPSGDIIFLPFAILCLPIGGPDCFSSLVDEDRDYYDRDEVVEGQTIEESSEKSFSRREPVAGAEITIALDGNIVRRLTTDSEGKAEYSMLTLVREQQIPPSALVHGGSLSLRAQSRSASDQLSLSTDAIPEAYFKNQYQTRREQLLSNRARHDNCDLIARDRREFFECYYQKGLLDD